MTPVSILTLYLVFRLKHFACDFMFQFDWMALNKGKPGKEGYNALFSHTLIHAIGTLLIMLVFVPGLWWLAIIDLVIHSIIDRLKGVLTFQKDWKPRDTVFWWAFGVDQELHNLTHVAYIVFIFIHKGGVLL